MSSTVAHDNEQATSFEAHPGESRETLPVVSFDEYREWCDQESNCFRRVGLLEEEGYEAAVEDPQTLFCEVDGRRIPALTPVEHEERYEAARTREMTESPQVMLLTVPLNKVREGLFSSADAFTGGEDLPTEYAILVEEPAETMQGDRESDHASIAEQFAGLGKNWQPHEFLDPRPTVPQPGRAWMAIYAFANQSQKEIPADRLEMPVENALVDAWEEYRREKDKPEGKFPQEPTSDSNETYLLTAEQVHDYGLVDKLWAIAEHGFGGVLGKYHPISMEVSKNFFEEHVQSKGTFTTVRFKDGEPICFGFIAPNMDNNEWLDCNSTILKDELDQAKEKGQVSGHFFELISKGEAGQAYGADIINTLLEVTSRTRKNWQVIFECPTYSGAFIPNFAQALTEASEAVALTEPVRMFARLDYWYLKQPTLSVAASAVRLSEIG